jgi:hypothetical protein
MKFILSLVFAGSSLFLISCGEVATTNSKIGDESEAQNDGDSNASIGLSSVPGDPKTGACRYWLAGTSAYTNAKEVLNDKFGTTRSDFCAEGINAYALPREAHNSAESCKKAVEKIYSYCQFRYSAKHKENINFNEPGGLINVAYAFYQNSKAVDSGILEKDDFYPKTISCDIRIQDCPNRPAWANQLFKEPAAFLYTQAAPFRINSAYTTAGENYLKENRGPSTMTACTNRAHYYKQLCAAENLPYIENGSPTIGHDFSSGCDSTPKLNAPNFRTVRGGCQFKDAFVIGEMIPRYHNKIWREAGFTGAFGTEFDGVLPPQYFATTSNVKAPETTKSKMHPDLQKVDFFYDYGYTVTAAEGAEFCKNNRNGGFDTWRLPRVDELKGWKQGGYNSYNHAQEQDLLITSDIKQLFYKDCAGKTLKGESRNVLTRLNGEFSEDVDGQFGATESLACFSRFGPLSKLKAQDRCRIRMLDPRVCHLEDYAQAAVYKSYKSIAKVRCVRNPGGEPKFADLKFSFAPADEVTTATSTRYQIPRGESGSFKLKAYNAGVKEGEIVGLVVGYMRKGTVVRFEKSAIENRKISPRAIGEIPISIAIEKSSDPKATSEFDMIYFQVSYRVGDGILRTHSIPVPISTYTALRQSLPDIALAPDFDLLRMDGTPIIDGMQINFPALQPNEWQNFEMQVKRRNTGLVELASKVFGNLPPGRSQMPEGLIDSVQKPRTFQNQTDPVWLRHRFKNLTDKPWSGSIILRVTTNSGKEDGRVLYVNVNFGAKP